MIVRVKIGGSYDFYTGGIWIEGEGWADMMNTKNRWKKTLAAKYGEDVEVECKEKDQAENKDEEIVDKIFRLYKSPYISSWTPGKPLPSLEEEEEEECFEPGRPINDIMALNP